MRANNNLDFAKGDTVQLRDGTFFTIENIRYIQRSKRAIGGTLYTLQSLDNPSKYKSYYEDKMQSEVTVVEYSGELPSESVLDSLAGIASDNNPMLNSIDFIDTIRATVATTERKGGILINLDLSDCK